jgi:hypothetical protein
MKWLASPKKAIILGASSFALHYVNCVSSDDFIGWSYVCVYIYIYTPLSLLHDNRIWPGHYTVSLSQWERLLCLFWFVWLFYFYYYYYYYY